MAHSGRQADWKNRRANCHHNLLARLDWSQARLLARSKTRRLRGGCLLTLLLHRSTLSWRNSRGC